MDQPPSGAHPDATPPPVPGAPPTPVRYDSVTQMPGYTPLPARPAPRRRGANPLLVLLGGLLVLACVLAGLGNLVTGALGGRGGTAAAPPTRAAGPAGQVEAALRASPFGTNIRSVEYRTAIQPATIGVDYTVVAGDGNAARVQLRNYLLALSKTNVAYGEAQFRGFLDTQIVVSLAYKAGTVAANRWDAASTTPQVWDLADSGIVNPAYR